MRWRHGLGIDTAIGGHYVGGNPAVGRNQTEGYKMPPIHQKMSPFPRLTLRELPTNTGKERTNYGWENLTAPKQLLRIPADVAKNAVSSMYAYERAAKERWEKNKSAALANLAAALAGVPDDEKVTRQDELLEPFYTAHGRKPVKFMSQAAKDSKGKLVKHKKGADALSYVNYDDPEGEDLPKNSRGKETAAFIDCIRIV